MSLCLIGGFIQVYTNGFLCPACIDGTDSFEYPSIVPYYGDMDTRPEDGGFIWYRLTNNSDMIQRAVDDIRKAYPSISSVDYLFIATWDHVGYFERKTDKVSADHVPKYSYGLLNSFS